MAWYLKFPADTGTANGNNKLIQISGISATGNVNVAITYAENATQPAPLAAKSSYLLDKRRTLNSVNNGGGGYLFENIGSITAVETSNYRLNGSVSTSNAWLTALANQVYSFDIGSTGDGVIAIGGRFSQSDSFPLFAVKTIVITDNRGAHTIDMSASNGTSNEFTSTDGLVSLRLFGFTDNSHWVFYSTGGTAYADVLQQGTYTSSGGVLASFRGISDTLSGGSYTSAGSTLAATQGYSSQLNGASYTSAGGQLSSLLGFSSTLQGATFTSSGGQLESTRGYGDTLNGGSYNYAGGILVSTVSGAAQSYVDVLLGGSYASAGASLASSRGYNSQLEGGSYTSAGGSLGAFYGYSSTLNGGNYAYSGNRLISTWSGEVTVTIEGYTIRFADDSISAKFHADDVSAKFDNDHVSVTWRH